MDSAALLSLEAKEHLAQFTSDLFPGLNDFRGSVSVSSSDELAALTLRQNTTPLSLTTLPAEGSTETTGFVVQSEIGPFGGQITTVKGDRVTIPSGAFVEATNITVKTVSQENFEDLLDMDLESEGFSFVSAVDIDSNGVSFERPIQFAAEAEVFPTDAQMIVVTIEPDFDGDGRPEMVFLTGGSVEASEALSEPFELAAADGSAVIALLGPIESMGFVSGTVLDPEGTPLEGVAIFELNQPDLLAFSNSQGEFDLGLFIPAEPVENLSLAVAQIPSSQLIATSRPSPIDGSVFNGKVTFPGPFLPRFPERPKTGPQTLGKKSPKQATRERVELLCGPEASQNRKLIQTAKEMLDKSLDDLRNKIKSDFSGNPSVPISGPAKITDRTPKQVSANLLTKKQIVENSVIDPGSFQPEGIGSKFDPTKLEFLGVSLKVEDFRATLRHTKGSIGFAHVSNSKLDKDFVVRAEIKGISDGTATVTGSASSLKLK